MRTTLVLVFSCLFAVNAFAQQPTACESAIAAAFGEKGAYFSNAHDGDAIDLTVGFSSLGDNDPNDWSAGDDHLYASSRDPDARSDLFIPPGGVPVKPADAPDKKEPYIGRLESGDGYSIIQFPSIDATLIVLHAVNVFPRKKDADGRVKFGKMGPGAGGEWSFRTIDPSKKPSTVWHPSFHYHFELYAGLFSSAAEARLRIPFDKLCSELAKKGF